MKLGRPKSFPEPSPTITVILQIVSSKSRGNGKYFLEKRFWKFFEDFCCTREGSRKKQLLSNSFSRKWWKVWHPRQNVIFVKIQYHSQQLFQILFLLWCFSWKFSAKHLRGTTFQWTQKWNVTKMSPLTYNPVVFSRKENIKLKHYCKKQSF